MAVTKALNETESQLNKDNDLKDAYNNAANTEDVTLVEKENSLEKLFDAYYFRIKKRIRLGRRL